MNVNRLITRIKRKLGISTIALPIDNIDSFILDILVDTTLPVFSQYQPHVEEFHIDISNMERVVESNLAGGVEYPADLYILPPFPGREVLYVKSVAYDDTYMRSSVYPGFAGFEGTTVFGDLLAANIGKQTGDLITNSITFNYIHPRKLYIYDTLISTGIKIKVAFEHDASMASIPPTAAESFFKLALLDVEEALYPLLKNYEGMDTAFGRIELKIDDWQGAADKREQLLGEWDDVYLLDAVDLDYH